MKFTDLASHYLGCPTIGQALVASLNAARDQKMTCVERWTPGFIQVAAGHAISGCDPIFRFMLDGKVTAKKYSFSRNSEYEEVEGLDDTLVRQVKDLFHLPSVNFAAKCVEFHRRCEDARKAIPAGIQPMGGVYIGDTEGLYRAALSHLNDLTNPRLRWTKKWSLLELAEYEVKKAPGGDSVMAEFMKQPGADKAVAFVFGPRED